MAGATRDDIRAWLIDAVAAAAQLDAADVDPTCPFHDFGLTSTQAVSIAGDLEAWLDRPLAPTLLFEHPTIAELATALAGEPARHARQAAVPARPDADPVCVVGLGCRFPAGADTPDRYWENLLAGTDGACEVPVDRWDAAAYFDADRMAAGKSYTSAGAFVSDIAGFDAAFFGIPPSEALRMDPQHRLLLEVAWEAFEHAGIAADRLRGSHTGVFVGMMASQEYGRVQIDRDGEGCLDDPYFGYGTAPSVAAGRLSYSLDLRGPSMCVDTACSSSLLAVHLATEALRRGECDLAVTGGVSALVHPATVVQACRAHMLAADGRCKTFDERADGFLIGEGCGMGVLERLSDARAAGHRVLATLRGSAVNQDGRTNGMTAPNLAAQAEVVRAALADADVAPGDVEYVEAHGSGTRLGDAIEISALQEVFGSGREPEHPLIVGAVKTQVGHLLGAAGIAGLVKAVLAAHHGRIPGNLHLEQRSVAIDWDRAPVRPAAGASEPWPSVRPRLAGVSSFGWSGTNVHVVLEAAEEPPRADECGTQILPLSARTGTALTRAASALGERLRSAPAMPLADIAFTLQAGRSALDRRLAIVCDRREDAADALLAAAESDHVRADPELRTVFLFPGTGDQDAGMGRELYDSEPAFRAAFDTCAQAALAHLDVDLRAVLNGDGAAADALARRTDVAHCAIFAVEYALARLLQSLGVQPDGMLGYSLGEYAAAAVAGVFAAEDVIGLLARRAALLAELPEGAMLAVAAPASILEDLCGDGVSLAASNGPAMAVASGVPAAIAALEDELTQRGVAHRRINTVHALHSAEMAPLAGPMEALVAGMLRNAPTVPFVSSATGTWITSEQAQDPAYWAMQMCAPVRFDASLAQVAGDGAAVLLEVGPGQTLTSLARPAMFAAERHDVEAVPTLRSRLAASDGGDRDALLRAVATYWTRGGRVEWERLHEPGRRRVAPLPTYPFEHQRFWPDGGSCAPRRAEPAGNAPDLADWGYAPVWRQSRPRAPGLEAGASWLVFCDGSERSQSIVDELRRRGANVVLVGPGERFGTAGADGYTVDPRSPSHHDELIAHLDAVGRFPERIVHAWSLTSADLDHGFFSLLAAVRAAGRRAAGREVRLIALSTGLHDVLGDEDIDPRKATLLGLCRTTEQEFRALRCRSVDVGATPPAGVVNELGADTDDPAVALRGARRWVQAWEPAPLAPVDPTRVWRQNGVYVITGGLGGLGLAVARRLAQQPVRLALLARTPLPPREQWDEDPGNDELRRRIEAVRELEALGAEVLTLAADVADSDQIAAAITRARERFGAIHGVIHAAGAPASGLIQLKSREEAETVLRPKVAGTLALRDALRDQPLDFMVLYSSAVVAHGGLGESDYCAANCFLDAFAQQERRRGRPVTAIDWGPWQWDAWSTGNARLEQLRLAHGITDQEGVELLTRILATGMPQVLVAQQEPERLAARWAELTLRLAVAAEPGRTYPRPTLRTPYTAPRNDLERQITAVWRRYLGLERVGVNDQFFELGGTSLIGLTIVGELERELQTALSAADLFAAPTPATLAALIAGRVNGGTHDERTSGRGEQRRRLAQTRAKRGA
jgi:phthiocerol/phenolphthiocerol synthesis type-I polyketide synthase E